MFTGIIESMGRLAHLQHQGSNIDFWIESSLAPGLKVDQSVAHNGVCLTVVELDEQQYRVTAVAETLQKTNLGRWQIGDHINLERSLRLGDRLDGHFVQGHVDAVAQCTHKESLEGSWLFRFEFPESFTGLVIEKGSVCLNGVSLTVFGLTRNSLMVTIIPYTYEHTNFQYLQPGSQVNIEFDVLGKYLLRQQGLM